MSVLFIVFKKWINLLYKSYQLKNIFIDQHSVYKKNYLLFFSEEDFYESFYGFEGLSSILFFCLFKDATGSLPSQDNGFYLQENQPWEISLIKHWNANSHKKIIGCPHSTVRFWDLRYYYSKKTLDLDINNRPPTADFFAINGDNAYNQFLETGYSRDQLIKVEALRYMYLDNIEKIPCNRILKKTDPKKILILGDYSKFSTIASINLLQDACINTSMDIEIIFKPHPACLIDNSDVNLSNIVVTSEPINQIINLSPVRGLDNIIFINSSEELREILSNDIHFRSINASFNYFYLDKGLKRWKKLLQIDDIKPNITPI